jgi:hypothetical protein
MSSPAPAPAPSNPLERRLLAALFGLSGLWIAWRVATVGMGYAYVQEVDGVYVSASHNDYVAGAAEFSLPRTIGIWTAAAMTLCVFSFLYRDNVFYKISEAIFIGVSAAYWMIVGFWTVLVPNLFAKLAPSVAQAWAMPGTSPVLEPHWYINLVPLILGIMLLWRLAPKGGWISGWPLAFIVGTFSGLRLVTFLQADFLQQIRAGVPEFNLAVEGGGWKIAEDLLIAVCTLGSLAYFYFSMEHKGALGRVSRFGIWVLMITFGAAFATTVMARIALLGIRFEFLFDDWLWLIDPDNTRIGV